MILGWDLPVRALSSQNPSLTMKQLLLAVQSRHTRDEQIAWVQGQVNSCISQLPCRQSGELGFCVPLIYPCEGRQAQSEARQLGSGRTSCLIPVPHNPGSGFRERDICQDRIAFSRRKRAGLCSRASRRFGLFCPPSNSALSLFLGTASQRAVR